MFILVTIINYKHAKIIINSISVKLYKIVFFSINKIFARILINLLTTNNLCKRKLIIIEIIFI